MFPLSYLHSSQNNKISNIKFSFFFPGMLKQKVWNQFDYECLTYVSNPFAYGLCYLSAEYKNPYLQTKNENKIKPKHKNLIKEIPQVTAEQIWKCGFMNSHLKWILFYMRYEVTATFPKMHWLVICQSTYQVASETVQKYRKFYLT